MCCFYCFIFSSPSIQCTDYVLYLNQVPGTTTYNLALYYMLENPLHEIPLLDSFVSGDDALRNSRFKLIPYISEVGTQPNISLRIRIWKIAALVPKL